MDKKAAWRIYHSSPQQLTKWETVDDEGRGHGLLLNGCPHCGQFQSRETYVQGFWANVVELVTDYSCIGISKCKCGKWSSWIH